MLYCIDNYSTTHTHTHTHTYMCVYTYIVFINFKVVQSGELGCGVLAMI